MIILTRENCLLLTIALCAMLGCLSHEQTWRPRLASPPKRCEVTITRLEWSYRNILMLHCFPITRGDCDISIRMFQLKTFRRRCNNHDRQLKAMSWENTQDVNGLFISWQNGGPLHWALPRSGQTTSLVWGNEGDAIHRNTPV